MITVTNRLMIDAIKGCQPSFEMMDHPFCKYHGNYRGSYGVWEWNHTMDCTNVTLEYLIEVYELLKSK